MRRLTSMMAGAAAMVGSLGAARADVLPTAPGPLAVSASWRSVALDVSALPPATSWSTGSVSVRFTQSSGVGSNQLRWALSSAAMTGTGNTIAAPELVYVAPSGALGGATSSPADATLVSTILLTDPYGGWPGPLVLNLRMLTGTATITNMTVTLTGAAAHVEGVSCDRPRSVPTLPFVATGISGVSLRWAPMEQWAGPRPPSPCVPAPTTGGLRRSYWVFTPPATGPYQFSTCSSDVGSFGVLNTALAVLWLPAGVSDCAEIAPASGGAVLVACNNDSGPVCTGTRASTNAQLIGGERYMVIVSTAVPGALGSDPTVGLAVRSLEPAPANDQCSAAVEIPGAGPFPWVSPSVNVVSATPVIGQGTDSLVSCPMGTSAVQTIWYSLTPAQSGRYEFSTCLADVPPPGCSIGNTSLSLRLAGMAPDVCGTSTLLACAGVACDGTRKKLVVDLAAGVPVLLAVGRETGAGVSTSGATLQVLVRFTPAVPAPVNDGCAAAIELVAGELPVVTAPVDVRAATNAGDPALPTALARTVWYTLTPAVDGMYEISTCLGDAPGCTLGSTGIAVFRAGGVGCASAELISQVVGTLQTTAAGSLATGTCPPRGVVTVPMYGGQRYLIVLGTPNVSPTPPPEGEASISARVALTGPIPTPLPGSPAPIWQEFEPNDERVTPQDVFVFGGSGAWLTGATSGGGGFGSGATSTDYWRVSWNNGLGIGVPLARMRLEQLPAPRGCEPHLLSLRGFAQGAGVIFGGTETALQIGRSVNWYAQGGDGVMVLRTDGSLASPQPYNFRLTIEPAEADFVADPVEPGIVTMSTVAVAIAGGRQVDTDMWLHDSSLAPIAELGNDDADQTVGSRLTLPLTPGVYWLALAQTNLANLMPSPVGDGSRSKSVAAWPGATVSSGTGVFGVPPVAANVSVRITDARRSRVVTLPASEPGGGKVAWVRLVVRAGPAACGTADIAATDALPGPDGQIDNGDFSLFFLSFFSGCDAPGQGSGSGGPACGPADIAGTDGSPGPDGRIDNGDFQAFFPSFFDGCP